MADAAIRNSLHRLWNLVQRPFFAHLAANARLHPFAVCHGRKQIHIGQHSRISAHSHLTTDSPDSSIRIGDRCLISSYAMLLTYGGSSKSETTAQ